ncbi:MAG: zinc-binding dehydrogenase [Nitriliruptorales bacterium]|nr:zinc-binding dehydrogenase [Nitriliruptorales bacterium]
MRAAWYTRQGPASEVLHVGDQPEPPPQPGDVIVRVAVSAVNPSDVKAREGFRPMLFPLVIPHSDAAGEIVAVAADVDPGRIGERVWLREAQWRRPHGAAARYTAVPADRACRLPGNVPFDVGACLGIPALTAHRCVVADGPVSGAVVVVRGAAGRVGRYAAQIAMLEGATVIATARRDADLSDVAALGVQHVVDEREDSVADHVLEITDGRGAARIVEVDFGTNLEDALRAVANNGVISAYASMGTPRVVLPFYDLMMRNITLRTVLVYDMPHDAKLAAISAVTRWLEDDALDHRFGPRFALDDIVGAHEAIEGGVRGVVTVQS